MESLDFDFSMVDEHDQTLAVFWDGPCDENSWAVSDELARSLYELCSVTSAITDCFSHVDITL